MHVKHVILMTKTFIGVRDVDEEVFRKFRAMTVEERMRLGEALTKAMNSFLKEKREEKQKKHLRGVDYLLKVKPFDFGPGTERTSEEVDEIVYGK